MLVELAAPFREELFEPLLGSGARREDSPDEPSEPFGGIGWRFAFGGAAMVGVRHGMHSRAEGDAGEPVLSRRVRNRPPARREFAEALGFPALERVKLRIRETDIRIMDANGARLLAARIRAGVAIGARVELVEDASDDSGLCAGDRGVVDTIDERGYVFVRWDRGFASEIDPTSTPIHQLAA